MNLRGANFTVRNSSLTGSGSFQSNVRLPYGVQAPFVGKLTGSNGTWTKGRAFGGGSDLGAASQSARVLSVQGNDLKLIGGKAFLAGSYALVGNGSQNPLQGFVSRLSAEDYSADGATAYFVSGGNPLTPAYPFRLRGAGNEVYVTGKTPYTLEVYGEVPPSDSSRGTKDMELLSLRPAEFIGAFDGNLRPRWLHTTARAEAVPPPVTLAGGLLAYDSATRRLYWGGAFHTTTRERLLLGEVPHEASLSVQSPDPLNTAGWLTAFDPDGKAIRQARLSVASAFAPIYINGLAVNTTAYSDSLLEGTTVAIAAQDREQNGTRNLVTGYTLDTQPGTTPANRLTLTLLTDTKVTFNWRTQHKLTINSDHASVGLIDAASAGNPEPLYGDTWVDDGTYVDATVGGFVRPVDAADLGSRYIVKMYSVSAPTPVTNLVTQTVERLRVEELKSQPMTGPVTVQYFWKKQFSVTANHTADGVRTLLVGRAVTLPNNTEVPGTRVASNGGELWFDANARLELGALKKDGALSLKGWRYASPVTAGFFPSTSFEVSDSNQPDDTELDVELDSRTIGTDPNNSYWVRTIPNLTRPISVLWSYGDTIYTLHAAVGEPVNLAAATPAIPTSSTPSGAWVGGRVVSGPPGSSLDNMLVWDAANQKAVPLRPGVALVEWTTSAGVKVVTQILSGFRGERWPDNAAQSYAGPAYYDHIATTPPVDLDPDPADGRCFAGLNYTTGDGSAASGKFSATQAGRSVLLFYTSATGRAVGDPTKDAVVVRVVNTTLWNASTLAKRTATIGSKLTSPSSADVPGLGYLINAGANYNAEIYDRTIPRGPIIPVNKLDSTSLTPGTSDLVIVWYQSVDGINWPYNPAWYGTFTWPAGNRIVIASRLGSEGFDAANNPQFSFDPERYEQVKIYNQPDRTKPGFNPNEEHARIYPSLYQGLQGKNVPAAFALRDDLNITKELIAAKGLPLTAADYTSDPYVLVQCFDKVANEARMAVYRVEREALTVNDPRVLELPGALGDPSYRFRYGVQAGELIVAFYFLNLVIGLNPCVNSVTGPFAPPSTWPNGTYFEDASRAQRTWFVDHKGSAWAVSGGSSLRARYFYRVAPDFWFPFTLDADAATTAEGDCVPLLPRLNLSGSLANKDLGAYDPDGDARRLPVEIQYVTSWPTEVPVLKVGETLTYAGGENQADHPDAPGLPGIIGFAAGEVVFDSKNPAMIPANHFREFMARIIAPLEARRLAFPTADLPSNLSSPAQADVSVDGDTWYFTKLPPSLQKRVVFKPLDKLNAGDPPGVLVLRGFVNDRTLGAPDLTAAPPPVFVLEPNVLTAAERDLLKTIDDNSGDWDNHIERLYTLSRNPNGLNGNDWNVGLEATAAGPGAPKPLAALGPGLALVTNPGLLSPGNTVTEGYVTIAENNHPDLGDAPVTMHVIKVDATQRYRGAIKTLLPANVFDEKITLRHTADFGGNVDEIAFAWWSHEEDGTVKVGDVPPGPNGASPAWSPLDNANGVAGQNQIDLHGNSALLLADNWFFTRYRHRDAAVSEPSWSAWAGAANSSIRDLDGDLRPDYRAQLATGWVKRVLDGINPYEARIRDFNQNTAPSTSASLVQQLGGPFVGPVALNASKDVVENLGLIELYETVLRRARDLSIDSSQPVTTSGINAALLLASTRLADFYTLLGHEAWDDALDPTIGFGNDAVEAGSLNASRFCFENQLPSLLEEELALLRGRDESLGRPVYNRLFWNFTKGEGEVAYALNYQITDVNNDGLLDEHDALKLYPMGHGDAWGHYLSAMRQRYDLLRSPGFNWEARSEYYNLLEVALGVDFFDERNFARTAAARARVAAEIVDLTFRARYSEGADKVLGYTDADTSRGWGVTEWARRGGQAALFDWITANALLPQPDPGTGESGTPRISRASVTELAEIATQLTGIQGTLDSANSGLNALGLDPDVLSFDLDPTHIDVGSTAQIGTQAVQGLSHFEQIYERALEALRNAQVAYDNANDQKARQREIALSAEQLRRRAVAQDHEYRNQLIAIFGTPYEGQIGPGKAYPAGYAGPDLNLFMYVDVNAITPDTVPLANADTYFDEYVSFYDLAQDIPEEFRADLEEHFLDDISLEGNTAVELLGDDLVHLKLPATAADYTFVAPASWGQRAAPGRLQTLVGEMLQVQADLALAVGDYDYLIKQLRDRVSLLQMRANIDTEILGIRSAQYDEVAGLNATIDALAATANTATFSADLLKEISDGTIEGLPKVVGLSWDATFAARLLLRLAMAPTYIALRATAMATEVSADSLDRSKELIDLRDGMTIDQKEMSVELRGMLHDVEELLVNEGVTRIKLFSIREQLRGLLEQYRATLQEGIRLIEERRNANVQLAADTQSNRYHDVLFRSSRHEAIERYRTLYDLAQRYGYMAAKAYDYETNFDPRDRASAQPLLTQIARTRSLGLIADTTPVAGEGLAGIMARLKANFRAVEGRLGFNNFQRDTTEFSLRREQARLTADQDWQNELAAARVADLWSVPEFRRYCRPFAPRGAPQPGLVLRFSTEVTAGKNFFGHWLGAQDSAYDPSLYATKIRAAGIRLEGYPYETLARTPYVYLVPAGRDYMTIPNSPNLEPRGWTVVDQAIPAPFITTAAELRRTDWIASLDTLGGNLGEIRRFSSFRAAVTPEDPALNVTRFIGRSVWNDRWILIIPGQSLHFNANAGLDEFVENVTDIKLTFETYGYSGN